MLCKFMKNMRFKLTKNIKERFLIFIIIFIILNMGFSFKPNFASSDYDTDYYANGYYISSYDVNMKIDEYGDMNIQETINVYATTNKHGIIRSIPTTNEVKRQDGTTYSNRAKITNLEVSENYTSSNEDGYLNIKIGDPYETFTGYKKYTISYKYSLSSDKTDKYDELYYNIIGNKWDTSINRVTFSITMPKQFDSSKLGFSVGEYGSTDTNNINFTVKDNTIIGSYDGTLFENEGLTVRCELPEGYFQKKKIKLKKKDYLVLGICVGSLIISFYIWNKYGRNKEKAVETVEFYPPKGLTSLDVGFFYYGSVSDEQVVSLLIELANKGYLKIENNDKSDDDFRIYPLKKLDENFNYKNYSSYAQKENISNEQAMFYLGIVRCIPKGKDYATKKDLKYKFYREANKIEKSENKKRKLIFTETKLIHFVVYPIIFILLLLPMFIFKKEINLDFIFLSDITFFAINLFIEFAIIFAISIMSCKNLIKAKRGMLINGFIGVIEILFYAILIFLNNYIDDLILIDLGIVIATIIINLILCLNYNKRTDYGLEMKGKIGGFRNFLKTVEKTKLEELVNEDPQYFYNILPYTYTLKVSNEWIKKFEDITIEPPNWYVYAIGDRFNSRMFINSFDLTYNDIKDSMVTSYLNSRNNSGSGFSGGGFSGGGFSGGGSGGGGGSSW